MFSTDKPPAGVLILTLHMDVESIYKAIYPYFRGKRLDRFMGSFPLDRSTTILDVGGCPTFWQYRDIPARITVLNRPEYIPPPDLRGCTLLRGDGTALDLPDKSFDIAHSNSVIEHVSTWERQVAFANEIRRVGHGVWVQTPAKCFPFECHTLDPFFYRLPKRWRRRVLRNGTIWGLIKRPSQAEVDDFLETTRLLTFAEMQELFPDCHIIVERFAGIPKSYIACRPLTAVSRAADYSADKQTNREFAALPAHPATPRA